MEKSLPAYQRIYNEIYDQILCGKFKPHDQLPVEIDLCKQYGVSRITIQKSLKMLEDKEIIIRIIGKGTFVADASDKIRIPKNRLIGVVLCNISGSFGTEMLKSIEANASLNGYSIMFKNSNFSREIEIKAIKELMNLNVAGLILQPTHGETTNPEIMNLILSKKPIVLVDRNLSGLSCSFVGSDNLMATKRVMNYLFSCGHRNICFVCSDPHNTSSTEQRVQAFKESFQINGFPFKDDFIFSQIKSSLSLVDLEEKKKEDIENLKTFMKAHPEITCYFALEYTISTLIKRALHELGIRNDKVSVVTFDYVSDPHVFTDTAYVKQYEDEIGYQAVRILINNLNGQDDRTQLYLPTEFVNMGSIHNVKKS